MSSSACTVCGSNRSKIIDGLMYCDVCDTQIFDFREVEDDEDQLVSGFGKIRTKKVREERDKSLAKTDFVALGLATEERQKKRKGEAIQSLKHSKGSDDGEHRKPNKLLKDITSGREHAPSYLRCVGTRLTAFTKILAKGVSWIRQDPAVPSGFADHTFAIYQRYLSACNVAYTSNDYTEDIEKMFRALVLNTNISFERAREKKARKERRKKRGKEALEKSLTAWDLLMGDTLDENLELRSDDEADDEEQRSNAAAGEAVSKKPKMITVVDTKIPKEILENATGLYLAMDVFVAILYVSVITIGCRWITLSDIVRWVREDRMGITIFQRVALECGNVQGSKISKTGSWAKMDLPLYEFQRTTLFIWQLCNLPPTPAKIDFKQIVARLLYHLNLPRAMMERVLTLMNAAPPCRSLDDESLRRQGRIEQGPFAHGFRTSGKDKFALSYMLNVFGRMKRDPNSTYTDIFFSTETKAFAFILMVLKMSFGLDDEKEVVLSKKAKEKGSNTFNFMQWFYQLKMRMMFWEGYDPLDILQVSKPVEPLFYEKEFPRGENTRFYVHTTQQGKSAYCFRYYPRDSEFTHCVPSTIRIDSSTSIPNPFSEDTYDARSNRTDVESVYVPLRSQGKVLRTFLMRPRTAEEKQEIRAIVDEEAVRVFKSDYEQCSLMEGTSSVDATGGISGSKFLKQFPSANFYKRYPRPRWTSGGVVHLKENDERLKRLNKRMGLHTKNSGLRMLFASRKGAADAWRTAKTTMSQSFALLIHWFSKIIGEAEVVLYAAFMILELQIIDRKKFEELKQMIVDGRIYPIETTKIHKNGDRSYKTLYISSAENVTEAHEVDVIRIGLPKNWASGIYDPCSSDDSYEELDYSSDSSTTTECGFGSSDSPYEEDVEKIKRIRKDGFETGDEAETSTSGTAKMPSTSSISKPIAKQRDPQDRQCDVRAYDFDTIWMLIAMRYW